MGQSRQTPSYCINETGVRGRLFELEKRARNHKERLLLGEQRADMARARSWHVPPLRTGNALTKHVLRVRLQNEVAAIVMRGFHGPIQGESLVKS